jgi:hypothetical protein
MWKHKRDGNCLFQWFCPFVAFESIQNDEHLRVTTRENYKVCMGKKLVCASTVKIIAISEICNMSVCLVVSEGQVT